MKHSLRLIISILLLFNLLGYFLNSVGNGSEGGELESVAGEGITNPLDLLPNIDSIPKDNDINAPSLAIGLLVLIIFNLLNVHV
jgi:hypothetical protein